MFSGYFRKSRGSFPVLVCLFFLAKISQIFFFIIILLRLSIDKRSKFWLRLAKKNKTVAVVSFLWGDISPQKIKRKKSKVKKRAKKKRAQYKARAVL